MITNIQAQIDAQLSHASYGDAPIPAGYQLAVDNNNKPIVIDDPKTGFHAEIYQKIGTSEYTVAFTGTQPNDPAGRDVLADLALGTTQWTTNKDSISAALSTLSGASEITFTGHSLGGALAQYAAYDYLSNNSSHPPVSLVTFNGLGGRDGLQQMYGSNFNPSIASRFELGKCDAANDEEGRLSA